MPTIEQYRHDMHATRLETAEAFRSTPRLVDSWTSKPGTGEGEESWSPLQVAQHVVYGEWFMLDGTVKMLSRLKAPRHEEIEQKSGEAAFFWARLARDQQGGLDLPGPEEAAAALLAVGERLDPILQLLTERHLALTAEQQSGPITIEKRLQYCLDHALDHLNQLRSL